MHQRLRCAGHGNVDLICPVGRRFGKVSRRGIDGEWGVAAMLRRRAWRQGLSALPYARFTEPSSTGGKWPCGAVGPAVSSDGCPLHSGQPRVSAIVLGRRAVGARPERSWRERAEPARHRQGP